MTSEQSQSGNPQSSVSKGRNPQWRKPQSIIPLLICLVHFLALIYIARQHPFGNYATETDFYHYYAPDAERLASGQFPQNTYQGPGYSATLAFVAKLTGTSGDLFTAGKWISVV